MDLTNVDHVFFNNPYATPAEVFYALGAYEPHYPVPAVMIHVERWSNDGWHLLAIWQRFSDGWKRVHHWN